MSQPGELTEVDNDWFRLIGKGRERVGQRLARTVSEGTSINTTARTEHNECVELESFSGNIARFAGDKKEGSTEAKRYTGGSGKLFFWMDGSTLDFRRIGASVA